MSTGFNLTAQLNLVGPTNVKQIAAQIKKDLGNVNATVNFKLDPAATKNVTALTSALKQLNSTLSSTNKSASSAAAAIRSLGQSVNSVKLNNIPQQINNIAKSVSTLKNNSSKAQSSVAGIANEMEEFGKQAGLAVRRFTAFATVTSVIYGLTNSINKGIQAFIDYDKELVRLQQVTGQSLQGLSALQSRITDLSTSLGVSSKELTTVAVTLAQAGLSAKDTERSLKALALSSLAPSFDDMNETVEGSIALMRQFGIGAGQLEAALGSVNTVAAKFAVEASDIITAIQRTGGVFATASKGVSEGTDALNEFISVFTSVRATTRESAETIATGLRTIFTRIQRGDTINALKEFGVNLTDTEGKFVGAYKAVQLLSEGLSSIDPRDLRFSRIVEELGGFRQIGKVIPLIQQFSVAQEALGVAQQGQGSLARDAVKAQLSLANQISKVREQFFSLFREIGQSQGFQTLVKGALSLSSALIKVADASKTLLPALSVMLAFRGARALTQFTGGFNRGFRGGPDNKKGSGRSEPFNQGGPVRKFARGGVVPGSGNRDTVPAMLMPGEFVIRKKAVETIGTDSLHKMNKYGSGGDIRRGSSSKRRKFASGGKAKIADISNLQVTDGDTFEATITPTADPFTAKFRAWNYDAYETGDKPSRVSSQKLEKIQKIPSNKNKTFPKTDSGYLVEPDTKVYGNLTAAGAARDATLDFDNKVRERLTSSKNDFIKRLNANLDEDGGFGRYKADLGFVLEDKLTTGRFAQKKNLGGMIQKFAVGGKATRNLGYIDFDIINDPVNAKLIEEQIKKSGSKGPREYTKYLTDLAIKAKKETTIKKLTALYGVAGAGKSSIAMGRGANDAGRLRETNRFPILTPEDISKASEVMLLTSTVSKDKLDGALKEADKIYALSTTTQEEKDRIRKQRMMRDVSGVGLFGRRAGATTGVSTDSAKEEALLTDRFGSKAMILGRGSSGRLRRKRGDELVQITKKRLGFTWGGFSPTTAGHESIMDAAKAAGIPYEDFIALVGANEAIDPQDDSYRTAIFDQDFRLLLAKAGFGAKGASVLPKAFGDMSVPLAFDMGERGGRRQITLPAAGSMAFVADKTDKQMAKYIEAGYGVTNLERTGGISGTDVRKLLLAGNLDELQKVVSPGVFSLLKNNLPQLQNRSSVIPSLVQQAQGLYKQEVASIDEQLAATGITRADNKKAAIDPDYAAQLEIYKYLKEQKKKLATKASFEPYRLLQQLAEAEPDKYALKFDRTGQPSTTGLQEAILKKVAKETSVRKSSGILPAEGREILKRFGDERLPTDPSFGPFAGKTVRDTAEGGKLKYWNSAFRPETKADKLAYYTATRDYLIDKFNKSQVSKTATALKDTTNAVLSSTQLGLVGLNPLGYTGLLGPETWNLGVDPSGQARSINASIVQRGLPTEFQNVIDYLSGQTAGIVQGASKLLGITPKELTKKQRETLGQGNIEGALLEQIFGSADATILDDALRTRPIDFPMGIGPKAAKIFGIDPNIPTEVKRTIDSGSRDKAVEEFQRFFRAQYGIPDPEKKAVKLAGGGQVNNIENRKYIGGEGKYLSEDQVRYLDRLEKDRDKNIEERNKLSDALNDKLGGIYGRVIKNRKDSKFTNAGSNIDGNKLSGSQLSKEKELAINEWYTGISKIGDRDFNRNMEQTFYDFYKRGIELDAKVDPIARQKNINELKKLKLEAEKIEAEMFAIRQKAYSSKTPTKTKTSTPTLLTKRKEFASGGLLKKYGEIFPNNNSTGPFKEMVFDFDDTLVTGGEIRKPDGSLDLSQKDNIPLVREMLKKGKLTPLGQHLSEAIKQEPSLIDSLSILSARNQNQAGILADTLSRLGLPIPASKIRGSDGPQNKKITNYQKMIDDNMETILRLKSEGKEAIHYKFAKGGKVEEEYKQILASILPKEMLTSDGYLKMPSGQAEPIDFIPERSLAEKSKSAVMAILLGKSEKVPPEEETGAFYSGGLMSKVLRHNIEKLKGTLPEDEYIALKQFADHRVLFDGNEDTIKTAGGLHKGVLAHETFHDIQAHLYDNHPEIIDKLHASLLKRKDAVEKWYNDPKNSEWAGPKDYKLEHFFPGHGTKSPYGPQMAIDAYNAVKKRTKKEPSNAVFGVLGNAQWDLGRNELVPVLLSAAAENNSGAIQLLSEAFSESGLNPDFYKTLPKKYKIGGAVKDVWHGTTTGIEDKVLQSFKTHGARSDISDGFGQGKGFYVYSDPTSAMVRAMELEGGANFLNAADPNGKPMALKFTELLNGKDWDLDYEFQNADIVNFIHAHYDRVKEALNKSKGLNFGNFKDFSLDQKYDEYLDTTDNKTMRKVGISFKEKDQEGQKLLANNDIGDIRSAEVLSSLVKSLIHSDSDFYEEFENSFFSDLKPGQGLKYTGQKPLKPVLAEIFERKKSIEETGWNTVKFAKGGSPQDTVPALLTPGEFVINKNAAQKIGYSQLHRLNKADKVQGFNKGGAVGIQKLASGGFPDPNSFIRRFGDWFMEQPKNNAIKRFDRRPDIVSRSSTQANKDVGSVIDKLVESINKLGYSAAESATVIKKLRNTSEVSYKDIEKALSNDINKLKSLGADFNTIINAEETLYAIRQQGKKDVDLKRNLEGAFGQRGSFATQFMGGKLMMGDINQGSAAAQNIIEKEAQYLISSRTKKLRSQGKEVNLNDISEKAYRIAAAKLSGIKKETFLDYGITGKDIKSYIDESKQDKNTLIKLDKEYIDQKRAELQRSAKFASVGPKQQQKMLRDLERESRREISVRRSLINDLASRTGKPGVGPIDMTDFNNSPVLKYLKSISAPQALTGLALASGTIAGQGKNIGSILYGSDTSESRQKAAAAAAGIESSGIIISTGLATAAEILASSPNKAGAIAAAVVAIGSGLYAAAEYIWDLSGNQTTARREQQSAERVTQLDVALEKLNRASKEFEADISNINLRSALSDALKDVNTISVGNAQFDIQEAKTEFYNQANIPSAAISPSSGDTNYMGSKIIDGLGRGLSRIMPEWTGIGAQREVMGALELQRAASDIASKNKETALIAQDFIRTGLNQGASRDQIVSGDEYRNAREAMLMADPKGVLAFNAAVTEASNRVGGRALQENELRDVLQKVTEDYYKQGNVILDSIIKQVELAKAMEAADRAGRQLAMSFQRMNDSINQSINRIQYESEQRTKRAQERIKGLSGDTGPTEFTKPVEIIILENPQGYSPEDFALAAGKAGDKIGGKEGKNVEGSLILGRFLPDVLSKTIAERLGGQASLTREDAAKEAIAVAQDMINNSSVNDEVKQKLIGQVTTNINEIVDKIGAKFSNSPVLALDQFVDELHRAGSAITGELYAKALDSATKMLDFARGPLNEFSIQISQSAEYMRQAAELRRKADKIMYKANIDIREIFTGVGESYNEAKAQTLREVGQLTGGITDPAAIGKAIRDENNNVNGAGGLRDQLADASTPQDAAKFAQAIQDSNNKIKNYNDALDKLANSTNMYEKALEEARNVAEIQKDRQSFVEKLLTNTPEEADNLNQAFIRLQRNLSGGLNSAWNQRDARKAFNEALFKTGSLREAYRAGNTVLANQRKETLGLMQDPGFRAILKGQIQNQRVSSGQGLMSEADLDNMFRQQEAQLMKQMAIESGYANNPVVMQAIQTRMNPQAEPMAQAAANQVLEAAGLQKAATEEQAKIKEVQAMELNVFAMDNLTTAIVDLTATLRGSFDRNTEIEGRNLSGEKTIRLDLGATDLGSSYAGQAAITASRGGLIYAADGQLIDFKPKGTDTVPAMLSPGEFVINAKSTAEHLPLLQAINNGYAKGGKVSYFKDGGLASIFRGFDKDRNNLLTSSEFPEYFSDFDLDKNNAIDMNEFLAYASNVSARAKLGRMLDKPGSFHAKNYRKLREKGDQRTAAEESQYRQYTDFNIAKGQNRTLKREQMRQNRQNDRMWALNMKGPKTRTPEEEAEYKTLRDNWKSLNPEKAAEAQARSDRSRMWNLNLKGKKRTEEEETEYAGLRAQWAKNNPEKAAAAQARKEDNRRKYLWSKGSKGRTEAEEAEYSELRTKWAAKNPEQAQKAAEFNQNSRRQALQNKGKERTTEEEAEFNSLKDQYADRKESKSKNDKSDLNAADKAAVEDANERVSGFINRFAASMGRIEDPNDYVRRWTLAATVMGSTIMRRWVQNNPGSFRLNKQGDMSNHLYGNGNNEYQYGNPGFKAAVRERAARARQANQTAASSTSANMSMSDSGEYVPPHKAPAGALQEYLNQMFPDSNYRSWSDVDSNQNDQETEQPKYFDIAREDGRPVIVHKDGFHKLDAMQKAEADAEYLALQKQYGYRETENGVVYTKVSERGRSSNIPLEYQGATSARDHVHDLMLEQAERMAQSGSLTPAEQSVIDQLKRDKTQRDQAVNEVREGRSSKSRIRMDFKGEESSAYYRLKDQAVESNLETQAQKQTMAVTAGQAEAPDFSDPTLVKGLENRPGALDAARIMADEEQKKKDDAVIQDQQAKNDAIVKGRNDRLQEYEARKAAVKLRDQAIRNYFGNDEVGKKQADEVIRDLPMWDKTTSGRPADYGAKFDADIIQKGLFRGKALVPWDRSDMISPDEAVYRYEAQRQTRENYAKGKAAGDFDKFDPKTDARVKGVADWLSGKSPRVRTAPIVLDTASIDYKPATSVKLDPISFRPADYDETKLQKEISDLETELSWRKRYPSSSRARPTDHITGLLEKKKGTLSAIEQTRDQALQDRVKLNADTEKRYQELSKAADSGKLSSSNQSEYIRLSLQRGKPYSDIRALPGDISAAETSMRRGVFSEQEMKQWDARERKEFSDNLIKEKSSTFYDKVANELTSIARKNVQDSVSKLTGNEQLGQAAGLVTGLGVGLTTGLANPSTIAAGVAGAPLSATGALALQTAAGTTAAGAAYAAGQKEAAANALIETATAAAINLGLRTLSNPKTWELFEQAKKEFSEGIANPPTLREFLKDPEMREFGKALGYTDLLETARTGQAVDTNSMFPNIESAVKGIGDAVEKIPTAGAMRGSEFGTGGGNSVTLNAKAARALEPEMLDLVPGKTTFSTAQQLTPKGEAAVAKRIQELAKATPTSTNPKLKVRGYFKPDAPGSITGTTTLRSPTDAFAAAHEESHAVSRILGILEDQELLTEGVVSKLPKKIRGLAEGAGSRISAMDEFTQARMDIRGTKAQVPQDVAVNNALARTQEEAAVAQSLGQKPADNPSYAKELSRYNSLLNKDPTTPPPTTPKTESSASRLIKRGALISTGAGVAAEGIRAVTAPPKTKKPQKKARGGMIYASNGQLAVAEPSGTDTVPAMLTPGEFVVNAQATKQNLGLLHSINRSRGGQVNYLAGGGQAFQTMELRADSVSPTQNPVALQTMEANYSPISEASAANPYSDSILPAVEFFAPAQSNAIDQAATNAAMSDRSIDVLGSRMEYDRGAAIANADMANMDLRTTGEMLSADAAAIGLGAAEGGVQLGAGVGASYLTGAGLTAAAPFTGGLSLAVAPVVVPAVGAIVGMGAKALTNKAIEAAGVKEYTDSIKEASPLGYGIGQALPVAGAIGSQVVTKGVQAFAGSAADRAFGATTGALSDATTQLATEGKISNWSSIGISAGAGALMPGKDSYEQAQDTRRLVGGGLSRLGEATGSKSIMSAGGEMRFSAGDRAIATERLIPELHRTEFAHAGAGWIPEGQHSSPVLPRPSRGTLGAAPAISADDMAANPSLRTVAETGGDILRMSPTEGAKGGLGQGAYFGSARNQAEAASLAAQSVDYASQATKKGSGTPGVLLVRPTDQKLIGAARSADMHVPNDTLSSRIGDQLGVDPQGVSYVPHSNRVDAVTPADVLNAGVITHKARIEDIRATTGEAAASIAESVLPATVAGALPPAYSTTASRTLGKSSAIHRDIVVPDPQATLGGTQSTTRGIDLYKSSERGRHNHSAGAHAEHYGKHHLPGLFGFDHGDHQSAKGHSSGGLIYANNGVLAQAASGTDNVPAMLTPGEFVVNRESSQKHMPLLNAINSGHFNRGGIVNYLANGGIVAPKYYAGGGQELSNAIKQAPGVSNNSSSSNIGDLQKTLDTIMKSMSTSLDDKISQMNQLNENMTGFIDNFGSQSQLLVDGLKSSTTNLGSYADTLSSVSLPDSIKLTGNVTSEHRFNGAEAANNVLSTLGPTMEQQTNNQLNNAFTKMNKGPGQLDSGIFGPDTTSIMGKSAK